ncbi:AcrR family transcriptional regulator [Leifsonia sp. AK011]|uniref:TetR/AcrR family transcriptional regulator n=1 Tax=Leifsonia sp. AK011 TaxID=2723075 RepID=UPI0015CD3BF1|nr:TetR/AcrR family transcriptional regulator [Leifsonia sp. AK011]NYF11524.1 AcrR family transcriptional regulator [Leifsonia sp. AK011]
MTRLRSDAARSRATILETARAVPVADLRLNDLARDAGLGVGTVYRHFPTVASLVEALNTDALEQLIELARAASEIDDPGEAVATLVRDSVGVQLQHDGLQATLVSADVSPTVSALRDELLTAAGVVLDRAVRSGAVSERITIGHVQRLVCGVEHAVRLGDGADRELLLDVMLAGLLSSGGNGATEARR